MSEIIKIYQQTNIGQYSKIIVFYGDSYTDEISDIFLKDPTSEIFKEVFSKHEIQLIRDQGIDVVFTKQRIYLDDSIEAIKKKIITEYSSKIAFEELYLYAKQIIDFNNTSIYENLSQQGKINITQDVILQFLSNIQDFDINTITSKDNYDFNDIISLNLSSKKRIVDIPLGQHFVTNDSMYCYSVNPFRVVDYSQMLQLHAESIITTSNKDLLLSRGFIFENSIYLTMAEDVLQYAVNKNISEKTTVKTYYPFLNEQNIVNKTTLAEEQISLVDNNKQLLSDKYRQNLNNINLFYDIYNSRKNDLKYIEQGIRSIEFTMSQRYEYNIPLDTIFKLIHASITVPFIKMNPSKKQENIYRLYCNKTSTTGKKIPYLSKSNILKLVKNITGSRRVTCYIEHLRDNKTIPILLGFDSDANIHVSINFKEAQSIPSIESILKESINPIIEIIQTYLLTSGYTMDLFSNLYEPTVEIANITYNAYISIDKNINLNNLLGCVSSVFNVVVGELKKGIVMRYKRVANFNEMDSADAFIVEMLNRANEDENIVKSVMDNFQMTETDAQLKIADLLNEIQVVQNLGKKRKLRIKNNPGFLTKITQDQFKQNIMIEMENINSIFYMSVIPIYLDSIIRITQDPTSSSIDISQVDALCKTKNIDDDVYITDIIADSEKSLTQNIPVAVTAQDLKFGTDVNKISDKDKSVNVLDFLFDDDDDDDDDDEDYRDDASEGNEITGGIGLNSDDEDSGIDVDMDSYEEDGGIEVDMDSDEEDGGIDVDVDVDMDSKPVVTQEPSTQDKLAVKITKKPKLSIQPDDTVSTDITGMSIADPNPFLKALREKDPTLFVTEDDGKYSAYSRLCPWNKRKHPVILTDEEKEKIDKESPGSYDQAIKYGSDPNKQYWYICPRYWDLKNNMSLTKEQAESGKYGKIIPQKINGKPVKKVPEGANIWEFTEPKEHVDKDGNYINYNPGFLRKEAHPDGLCVPCCFKVWDGKSQRNRRAECNQDATYVPPVSKTKQELDEYIKGPDKFPLQEGRFGYLPTHIQRFLMIDNKSCQISATNTNLKKNRPCYLRKGVESSKTKSFLGCIADVYSEMNDDKTLSINDFIQNKILVALTIDKFTEYQNGNLITEFQSKESTDSKEQEDINVEQVVGSKVYNLLYKNNIIQLKKIVSAYNNFRLYLQSTSAVINYTYMWDLICDENKMLFAEGVNLVILEVPLDDTTSNVNVICPSNFYSNNKFDDKKNTIILMKKYEYFEPIYIVTDKSKTSVTSFATVKMYTPELFTKLPNLKELGRIVKDIYSSMCKPLPSILNTANKYNFKEIKFIRNNTLDRSIEILQEYNIDITKLVINYDSKVIGIIVTNNNITGFVPCFPSGIVSEYDMITMDELTPFLMKFEETVEFLQGISKKTERKILSLPVVKIIEDELIVGLLTQTNQFIEILEPEQDNDMVIKYTMKDDNYFSVNNKTINTTTYDKTRIEYIKKIKLETSLFNEFRNKLKVLLSTYENKIIRDEIESISNSKYLVYDLQMDKLMRLLKTLMNDGIEFVNYTPNSLPAIEKSLSTGDVLLIPKINLMSELDNESIYYSKLADELIRYNRIKKFMFEPKMFLNFNSLKYNLNSNEIILLHSLLTQDYFDDLVPVNESKYISFNSYDRVQPNTSQKYDNQYITQDNLVAAIPTLGSFPTTTNQTSTMMENKPASKPFNIYASCPTVTKQIFSQLKVKFPSGFKEIEFSSENYNCTFDVLLTIYNSYMTNQMDLSALKNILAEEYENLYQKFPENILNIVDVYGSIADHKSLKNNTTNIRNIIMQPDYNMNIIDVMILSNKYNIPITLVAPRQFNENKKPYMCLNVTQYTYIIRTPGFNKYINKPAKYKLLLKNNDARIELNNIKNDTTVKNILGSNISMTELVNHFASSSANTTTDIANEPSKKTIKIPKKLVLMP